MTVKGNGMTNRQLLAMLRKPGAVLFPIPANFGNKAIVEVKKKDLIAYVEKLGPDLPAPWSIERKLPDGSVLLDCLP